jgi:hypothetical protein
MNCARRIPRSFAGRMHCRSVRGGTLKLKCRHPASDDVVERIERRVAERISTKTWETVRWAPPHSSRLGPMRPVVPAGSARMVLEIWTFVWTKRCDRGPSGMTILFSGSRTPSVEGSGSENSKAPPKRSRVVRAECGLNLARLSNSARLPASSTFPGRSNADRA